MSSMTIPAGPSRYPARGAPVPPAAARPRLFCRTLHSSASRAASEQHGTDCDLFWNLSCSGLLLTEVSQRERSRSRRRSRSPGRSNNRGHRSLSPRSGSRSPRQRRSRSPMTGQGASAGGSGQGYRQPHQGYEDRTQAREQMMSSIRDNSQQDRRVYVGNLSYDVKWHHLKDFMRQGGFPREVRVEKVARGC